MESENSPLKEDFTRAGYTDTFPLILNRVLLEGPRIRLEPLEEKHFSDLCALTDPRIWIWYPIKIQTDQDLSSFLRAQLHQESIGTSLAFAIRTKDTQEIVGATRFLNIDHASRRVEIGSTWIAPKWQRTYVNTESKLLMLTHAFESLQCICVQLMTDLLNAHSRKAIERLGARQDGILRSHRITFDGRIRDTVVYSVTHLDWPAVKRRLQFIASIR